MQTLWTRLKPLWLVIIWGILLALMLEVGLRVTASSLPAPLNRAAQQVIAPDAAEPVVAWQSNPDHQYIVRPGLTNSLQYGSPSVAFRVTTRELWEGGGIGFRNRPVDYGVHTVAVGDSFTFCFVEQPDCWVTQLEQQIGTGVVNLGQPVTGTQSHYLILRDFGQPLEPQLVIWQFFGNDFNDDYGLLVSQDKVAPVDDDTITGDTLPTATPDSDAGGIGGWLQSNSVAYAVLQAAFAPSSEDPTFVERYAFNRDDGQQMQYGQPYEAEALDMSLEKNQIGYEASREAFQQAQDLVDSWSWESELVVVIVPTREEVYAEFTADEFSEDLDAQRSARLAMLDLCDELALTCYDPLDAMQARAANTDLLYYADDMHLNATGNRVFADLVYKWLERENRLPDAP